MSKAKQLLDLVSVGPATVGVLEDLGITEVEHLVDKDATELYTQLQQMRGGYLDKCVLDVFRCAIEQARDPNLPAHKKQWHYWSKIRKQG